MKEIVFNLVRVIGVVYFVLTFIYLFLFCFIQIDTAHLIRDFPHAGPEGGIGFLLGRDLAVIIGIIDVAIAFILFAVTWRVRRNYWLITTVLEGLFIAGLLLTSPLGYW